MRIFVSHASKNKDIVVKFARFLESIDHDIEVFCSSDVGTIATGENFVKRIFDELNNSELFLPIISKEYCESKFCMIELGVAYSYLQNKYENQGDDYFFPFALYPMQRSEALSGTPMGNIQVGELSDETDVRSFLNYLEKSGKIICPSGMNRKLNSFKYEIDQIFLNDQSILKRARINTCFDDSIYFEKHDDVVEHSVMEEEMMLNYNMNPYGKINVKRPNFISLVMGFIDKIDIGRYLDFNEDAQMSFKLTSFTNSVKKIYVEFKYSDNHIILDTFEFSVLAGENLIRVPLKKMRSKALNGISEICFVIHPEDVIEDEGMFKISSIKVQ
ncbi:MAG: toll/interleukin-1 receptor domain-containing protein [Lachnospiraceae bacterium]|nr:toll/interleukin-1 receptor domain-containing protein [Lachnospiraceae bacterium]